MTPPLATETTMIAVRFTVPGFHHWPLAPLGRAYLAETHRHLFHVELRLEVFHDDREVEFHDLLAEARDDWPAAPDADLGARSCEHLARQLADTMMARHPGRAIAVAVFEDGEVGALLSRPAAQ